MIALCITLLFFVFTSKEITSSFTWKILDPPIAFGEDVTLFCNASDTENCCGSSAAWLKGYDIIADHTALSDSSKYGQKQNNDGFSLIIKNFDEDDINQQYTCLFGFSSCTAVLKINRENFKYWPIKGKATSTFTISDKLLFADIILETIYPSPECAFVINENMVPTNVSISEKRRSRLFHETNLHLVSGIHHMECIDYIAINCIIGGETIIVDRNNISYCPDLTTSIFENEETKKTTMFSIIFASVLTTCVAVVIGMMIWRKKKNNGRTTNINDEDGDLLSTSLERSCSVLCWRLPTILIVTSETIPLIQTSTVTITRVIVICLPAQNYKDVTELLRYVILYDYSYTQKMSTDIRINAVRQSIQTKRFNPFICCSVVPSETSISDKFLNKHQLTTNVEMSLIESNRMIHRIILEVNAFLKALTSFRPLGFTWNDKPVENIKSSSFSTVDLILNDSKRPKRSPVHTAQKAKDVGKLINYATLHDRAYIQRLTTDIGTNHARCRSNLDGLNVFTCLILSVTRKGHRNTAWVFCPAQKDVHNILYYATLCDKTYIQKLVTNTRINIARQNRPAESKTPRSILQSQMCQMLTNLKDLHGY